MNWLEWNFSILQVLVTKRRMYTLYLWHGLILILVQSANLELVQTYEA
jgi:hypothetical protein